MKTEWPESPPRPSLDRFRLQPGDIVLARRGELGRCAVVRDAERGWLCGTGCFLLRPADVLADLPIALPDPEVQRLVARLLKSADARERLLREGMVMTQRIRDDAIRGLLGGKT